MASINKIESKNINKSKYSNIYIIIIVIFL